MVAEICITSLGNLPLGVNLAVYSDADGYTTQFATVNSSSLVPPGCPYTFSNAPEGTQIILFIYDGLVDCCLYVGLYSEYNLCAFCELGFDDFENNSIGLIVAGALTGSCDNNITGYTIGWYNQNNQLVFTSGFGPGQYNWGHPISVPCEPGTYIPIIQSIELNGIVYAGNVNTQECLTTVDVASYNCNNGQTPPPNPLYEHLITFSNTSQSLVAPNLSTTFTLSPSTNYFAYAFQAESVSDTLKISYIGGAYQQPLVVEFITLPVDPPSSLNPTTFPKTFTLQYIKKIINLTNITYSTGDYLLLEVIPNPGNPNTEWTLEFKCLDSVNCTDFISTKVPFKIFQNSISAAAGICGQSTVSYKLNGCSTAELNSDLFNYLYQYNNGNSAPTTTQTVTFNTGYNTCTQTQLPPYNQGLSCAPIGNGAINTVSTQTTTTQRTITIKFQLSTDFDTFNNSYTTRLASAPASANPTVLDYYTVIELALRVDSGQTPCGDSSSPIIIAFGRNNHTYVTSNISQSPYTKQIVLTINTVTNQYTNPDPGNSCNQCYSNVNGLVSAINNSVTQSQYNINNTNNKSSSVAFPFYRTLVAVPYTVSSTGGVNDSDAGSLIDYALRTYPAGSNPLTIIPNLTATTCPNAITNTIFSTAYDPPLRRRETFYFRFVPLTSTPGYITFEIYSKAYSSGQFVGSDILIYRKINGVESDVNPAFFV